MPEQHQERAPTQHEGIARVGACPRYRIVDAGRESPSGRSASEDSGRAAASGQTWDAARVAELEVLRDRMRKFAHDRDWAKFHDPKSVILALVGEVGELAELFQWLPATDARDLARAEPLKTRASEEMADVLLYLVLLADVLGVDLATATLAKMDDSERRFPPSLIAGTAPERDR
jgi:NTP pyrophosphatase (non-canonical NTP hydrolase)